MKTTEKLATALLEARAPADMIQRARDGFYDDYRSPVDFPIAQLVADAHTFNLPTIAERAIAGDFDGTPEESAEWERSPEGRAIFAELIRGAEPQP